MANMSLQSTYNAFPAIAIAGQIESPEVTDCITLKNAGTASVPFGYAVAFKPSPTNDKDAYLPNLSSDKIAGICGFSQGYAPQWTDRNGNTYGELDGTGVVTGVEMNIVRRGRVAVVSTNGNSVGDRLYVAYGTTAGSVYTTAGQVGNVTDTYAISCVDNGQFLTSASALGLAWLDCLFVAH
jgi:hypothetical protein